MYNSVGYPANRTWHALSHIGTYRIIPTSYIWHALSHIGTYNVILTNRVILTSYVWNTSLRMFYGSLFVLFVLYLLVIVLSVLLGCTGSNYPFGIFKLFLYNHQKVCVWYIYIDCYNILIKPLWRFAFARFVRQVRILNVGHIHTFYNVRARMLNSTFNNIQAWSCRLVLLVEETGMSGENHRPAGSHWQTLSHNVVSGTPRLEWNAIFPLWKARLLESKLSNAVSESYIFIESMYLVRIKHIFVKGYLFYNLWIVFSDCSDNGVFVVFMSLMTYFAV